MQAIQLYINRSLEAPVLGNRLGASAFLIEKVLPFAFGVAQIKPKSKPAETDCPLTGAA